MENKGKENKLFNILKIIWKVIEKIVMIAIVLISAIIITQNVSKNEQAFLGFRIYRVLTGSMIPKYQVGDVILVKEKDINKIKIGDDVTYHGTSGAMKGKLVTHQVIDIQESEEGKIFHTKGIANLSEDPVIKGEQITGVVQCKMYIVTALCSLLTNKYIFYFLGILPITLYIFFSFMRRNTKKYE